MGSTGDIELEAAARRGEPEALARRLVSTPSVNPVLDPDGQGERQIAELAAGWLESWGLRTSMDETAPGRCSVVASLAGARPGPTLLLAGHLDTVGVGGMTVPPFEGVVREGWLLGRGACDMKGGLAAALATAAVLAREGLGAGTLLIALTADEEHASLGMTSLLASGASADWAVICEPTGLAVMPAHKGFAWIDLTFRGRAAHGSRPDLGVDAVRHAAHFIAALDEVAGRLASGPPHPLLGHGSLHVGTIRGGTAPSVFPAECALTLERRTLPGETAEGVTDEIRSVLSALGPRLPGLEASLEVGLWRAGSEVSGDSPLVEGLLVACTEVGRAPRVEGMTAWVEAGLLNESGVPAVCFGPGSIARAHADDEACEVGEIRACAQVLQRFAQRILAQGRPVTGGRPR